MKWSDLSRVETLLSQRKTLVNDKARLENGTFDCTILGHYQRDYMTDSELEGLRDILNAMTDRRIAEIDAKLTDLGITIDDPDAS